MKHQQIKDLLNLDISKPLVLEPRFIAPSRCEDGERCLGEDNHISSFLDPYSRELNNYFSEVFGHLSLFPFCEDAEDAFTDLYEFSEETEDLTSYVNTKIGHQRFLTELTNFSSARPFRTILLIGSKGSGKTFYINFLLGCSWRKFYREKNALIFRLDLFQLYDLHPEISEASMNNNSLNAKHHLLEFLAIKTLFTSYVNKENYRELGQFWNGPIEHFSKYLVKSWNRRRISDKYNISPDNCYTQLKNKFVDLLGANWAAEPLTFSEHHIFEALNNRRIASIGLVVFDCLMEFLNDVGINLIYIIDGVDNLDYYKKKETYDSVLRQLNKFFISRAGVDGHKAKVVIVLRNESSSHLTKFANRYYRERIREYRIKEDQCVESILFRKRDVALGPQNTHIMRKRAIFLEQAFSLVGLSHDDRRLPYITQYLHAFDDFVEKYIKNMCDTIAKNMDLNDSGALDEKRLLSMVFNNNVRALLFNCLSVHKYERLAAQSQHKRLASSRYVFAEGQLLNGRTYLDTNTETYQFGKCIPNIFWFNCHSLPKVWHGLCTYRLLQLGTTNFFDKDDIILRITEDFNYDIEIVEQCFLIAVQHGLFFSKYDVETESDVLYRTSEKGRFLLKYVFSDANIFYFLALDTPVSNSVQGRSNFLRFHKNTKQNAWEEFPEACIITGLTFLRHILVQHKEEMRRKSNAFKSTFRLPRFFPDSIINGLSILVESQLQRNPDRGQTLISDIQGRLS